MTPKDKHQKYFRIIEALKSACHYVADYRKEPSAFSLLRCNFNWFSDTFILFSNEFSLNHDPDSIEELLIDFFRSVKALFLRFLYYGFPLRGGISYGEFIAYPTENIFIGEALIDAYKNTENHAWAGIAVLPDLSLQISNYKKVEKLLATYNVPINNKPPQEMTVINWASDPSITSRINPEEYITNKFCEHCDAMDSSAENYCKNTKAFLKAMVG